MLLPINLFGGINLFEYVHHSFQFNINKYIMPMLSPADGLGKGISEIKKNKQKKTMTRKPAVSSGIAILAVEILSLFTV